MIRAAVELSGEAAEADVVVCHCLKVTETDVRQALVIHELQSLREVACRTGAGSGCTACHERIAAILGEGYFCSPSPICSLK